MILFFGKPAFASGNDISVYYLGKQITFDVQPEIINDRVFVPIRAVAEDIGGVVVWHEDRSIVEIICNGVVELQIGNKSARTWYRDFEMDVAPFIENGRTLVPLRFAAEGLDKNVEWNGADRSVNITDRVSAAMDSYYDTTNGFETSIPKGVYFDRTFKFYNVGGKDIIAASFTPVFNDSYYYAYCLSIDDLNKMPVHDLYYNVSNVEYIDNNFYTFVGSETKESSETWRYFVYANYCNGYAYVGIYASNDPQPSSSYDMNYIKSMIDTVMPVEIK